MVTRGLYPRLVRRNVKKHLDVMRAVGVDNFIVEVVTVRNITYQYRCIYKFLSSIISTNKIEDTVMQDVSFDNIG